jgi:hypothetical protein
MWVESTPVRRISISGSPACTTDWRGDLPKSSLVSLTAPATFTKSGKQYTFVRWIHNGLVQPEGKRTLEFRITEDTAELAVYK